MGITGLIPFLEKASSKVHLKELKGTTVAIDTYCWLHKGVFSCAEKLVRGEHTDQYINYCLKYVQMILSFDIKPILVFDGMHLPAKALTEKRRRESRRESKKRAAELLRLGKIEEARSHMRRCVDVTHEMALRLIREMRERNVDCIVAPYEADAQMAWLNKVGIAQYIITEDSDLTLFGAQNIIFKLDLSGNGLLVKAEKLHLAMGCSLERYTFDKFRRMCILSGCDYLDSLPGIGLAKACKFILKTEQENMCLALKKIPHYLNMKQLQVDDEYIENFLKAEATFRHMYIFNPLKRKMERLNELEDFQTDERYCCNAGTPLDNDEVALNLALGNLNPFTLKQLDTYHPDRDFGLKQASSKHIKRAKHKSMWLAGSTSSSSNSIKKEAAAASCALYFKKVDFISTTIEGDISASLCEENAKPAEADIFEMYRNEKDEPDLKRRRINYNECSPPSSPKPTRHNPFAKSSHSETSSVDSPRKTQAICANSSLLKVLSPKKFKEETKRVNSLKRNIFAQENAKVQVRSRFFAENVKLVSESAKTTVVTIESNTKEDLSEEIESIERLTQEQTKIQALLYNSPSPDKYSLSKCDNQICLSYTDSGNESQIVGDLNAEETTAVANQTLQTRIDVSDDDDDVNVRTKDCIKLPTAIDIKINDKKNVRTPTSAGLDRFKLQTRPRVGLPKPTKSINKKNQKSNISSDSNQNQTRLSMFGFQKRPTLKLE